MNKEFEYKNEWAIILGGSSGLGLATAKKLAKHGLNICIVHRNSRAQKEEIEEQFKEIQDQNIEFLSFNIDALNIAKRENCLVELKVQLGEKGKIKTLIHSIAKGNLKPMISEENQTLQNDDFQITINAMAVSLYDWFKAIFDKNLFSNDARIISFTSEGNTKPWPNYAAVSAAKVTLEAISRNIALEFAAFGIRANCIQAGVTDTASLNMIPNSDAIKKHTLKRNPFQKLTTPENVANAAYLLCKKEASWINGTILKVDGGESLN
ncbi:SDR family oxidoreductase [Polaribacter sp.]|uniref:SDR family oxidoreductase n=1 Tax=Polaribacter sp. TaxID=1920175 RepID=UPI0025EFC807|nr:SDR family oxidoreductase [Polaribacter sp.]